MARAEILALSERVIAFHPVFARITGDVESGLFLSQLFYWTGKGARDGGWVWKTYAEWTEETCLTRRKLDRARKVLRELGLLEESLRGIPATLHYRLNVERLATLLEADWEQRQEAQRSDGDRPEEAQDDCPFADFPTEPPAEPPKAEEAPSVGAHFVHGEQETLYKTNSVLCTERTDSHLYITTEITSNIGPTASPSVAKATDDPPPSGEGLKEAPRSFSGWVEQIRKEKNRVAALRRMFCTLYPEHDPPDYGYIGRVARKVGGEINLARLLWEMNARPPVGDVLAYIQKAQRGDRRLGDLQAGRIPSDEEFFSAALRGQEV